MLIGLLITGCKTTTPTSVVRSAIEDSGGSLMKEQADYDAQDNDLSLRVDPVRKFISSTETIEAKVLKPMSWLVLDLDPRLKVKHIRLANAPGLDSEEEASFEHRGSQLWVLLNQLPTISTGSSIPF